MDADRLLDVIAYAGKLLIESGAEIYRVEETMVRLCRSFSEVDDAESFVTLTGIMFSITMDKKTSTKILRVHTRGVDLNCIDQINSLSRRANIKPFTLDELDAELHLIGEKDRYSGFVTCLFGALSASGFAWFFKGNINEIIFSFVIGFGIKIITKYMEIFELNDFFINAIGAAFSACTALLFYQFMPTVDIDIMIISSIMLLVPGLAITNAIRDTVAGDYLSGVARATEAFLVALAIAAGIGFILSIFMR